MTLDDFAENTRQVIATIGFSEFQATFGFPDPRHLHALAQLPTDEAQRDALMRRMGETAQPGEEFLTAFKVSEDRFKVIRCADGNCEQQTYVVA